MSNQTGSWEMAAGVKIQLEGLQAISIPLPDNATGEFLTDPDELDEIMCESKDGNLLVKNTSEKTLSFEMYWLRECGQKWKASDEYIVECNRTFRAGGNHGLTPCKGTVTHGPKMGEVRDEPGCMVCGKTMRKENPECTGPSHKQG